MDNAVDDFIVCTSVTDVTAYAISAHIYPVSAGILDLQSPIPHVGAFKIQYAHVVGSRAINDDSLVLIVTHYNRAVARSSNGSDAWPSVRATSEPYRVTGLCGTDGSGEGV